MDRLFKKVCKGDYKPIPDDYSNDLKKVVSKLLTVETTDRPSSKEILGLPEVRKWEEKLNQS